MTRLLGVTWRLTGNSTRTAALRKITDRSTHGTTRGGGVQGNAGSDYLRISVLDDTCIVRLIQSWGKLLLVELDQYPFLAILLLSGLLIFPRSGEDDVLRRSAACTYASRSSLVPCTILVNVLGVFEFPVLVDDIS
ncbi:uncharacterized protein LOC115034168 [Acyrthosiphon pisum]|uniref:Uncharacterized protein n=1 Tax=Acyrthosiphon pisum TaxID=7029 RepID=A0A8R2NTK6_ACYPI|nr:uncharacterized protein LOC115034168 [Acyrthosiphon pisum]